MDSGRLIVITGVTGGLGEAMVAQFIAQGHRVAGCGRRTDRIAKLQASCGQPHRFAVADVADNESVRAWADALLADGDVPDLLINNAAVINPSVPLWEMSAEEAARVIDINVTGTIRVLQAFLPAMVKRSRGIVVNLSSGWGRSTSPHVGPYCASKWAIEGLTRSLAQELPTGMAAVALNPGIIATEMLRSCFGEQAASHYPDPAKWAGPAVRQLLALTPRDNGKSLDSPG